MPHSDILTQSVPFWVNYYHLRLLSVVLRCALLLLLEVVAAAAAVLVFVVIAVIVLAIVIARSVQKGIFNLMVYHHAHFKRF